MERLGNADRPYRQEGRVRACMRGFQSYGQSTAQR